MRAGTAGLILLGGVIVLSVIFSSVRSQDPGPDHMVFSPETEYAGSDIVEYVRKETPLDLAIRSYRDFLDKSVDSMGTVGAAATIVKADETVFDYTYGVRRAGTHDSVDRHTIFRLASVSKGFAGVLAALLEEQGYLEFEDPVIDYLPDFRLKDSVNTYGLNINHLLNHTSGLVPHAFDNLAEAGQTIPEILPRLVEVDIALPPGEVYGYQNVLFSLTDSISRLATGQSYSELLEQKIFDPLSMNNASTGYRDLVWDPNVAFPHYKSKGKFNPLPLHTGYYNLLPAAGVNASIADLGLWLRALLGYSPEVISPEVRDRITTPQIKTPLKRSYLIRWDRIDSKFYSYGWRIYDYKGYRIIYHGGYVRGYQAQIAFCPELEIGIAFLQNSPNGVASRSVPTFFNFLIEEIRLSEID